MKQPVNINTLEEGQKLAEPVINNFGQVLIPAGTEITGRHINLLKTWSIKSVIIKDEDSEENEFEMSEELKEAASVILANRLLWTPENQFEEEIYNVALYSIAREIK